MVFMPRGVDPQTMGDPAMKNPLMSVGTELLVFFSYYCGGAKWMKSYSFDKSYTSLKVITSK